MSSYGGTPFYTTQQLRTIIDLAEADQQAQQSGLSGDSVANYIGLLNASVKTSLNSGSSGQESLIYTSGQPFGPYPEGHEPFDEVQYAEIPSVGGIPVTVLSYLVPNGFAGVIERYSVNFGSGGFGVFDFGELVWRMYSGSKLVRNFDAIKTERGTYQEPRRISNIRISGGDLFKITIEHPSNPALNGISTACISGYIYPLLRLS